MGPQDGGHGRRGREQADDDRAVRGGLHLQGERAEQREADDDPAHDDPELLDLLTGRARSAYVPEVADGQDAGHRRPAEGDEPGVEAADGGLGRGEGE